MKTQPKKLILRVLSLSTAIMILCMVFAEMPAGTYKDLFGFYFSASAAMGSGGLLDNVSVPDQIDGIVHEGTVSAVNSSITIAPAAGYTFSGDSIESTVMGRTPPDPEVVAQQISTTAKVENGNIVITINDSSVGIIDSIDVSGVTENYNYALKLTNEVENIDATLYSDEEMTSPITTQDGVFTPYAVGVTVYIKLTPATGYEITSTLQNGGNCIFNYNSSGVTVTHQSDGTYTGSFTTEAGDVTSTGVEITSAWQAEPINYTLTGLTLTNATAKFTLNSDSTSVTKATGTDIVKYTITPAASYILNTSLNLGLFTVDGGTPDAYSNGVLTITNVTGNVTIDLTNANTSVVVPEEYDGTKLPVTNTVLISDENINVDDNLVTWANKDEEQPGGDNTVSYGDTVIIPVFALGFTITGTTPTISINGGGIQVTGAYSSTTGNVTFTMPDIGDNGASIDLVEIDGLTTSTKSYDINYNKSAMRIYSEVAAPVSGAVNLTGKTVDTDGTLAMKGSTGYYAEIIPPAGATSYDVTPKLFGIKDPDGNWGFIASQPVINEIKDANGKVVGLYFTATPEEMEKVLFGNDIYIEFINVVFPIRKITYDSNGATSGTVPAEDNSNHQNDVITLPGNTGNLTKTGYTFGGWSLTSNGTAVTSHTMGSVNVTFYAVWNAVSKHTVTYNGNGNDGGKVPTDSNTYSENAAVVLAGNTGNLTKTGYTFGGWSLTPNGTAIFSHKMGTKDVVVYAVWNSVSKHTVTYNGNGNDGGKVPTDSNTYSENAAVVLAGNTGNLTKTGYTFGGWSMSQSGTKITEFKMGTENVTVYAIWNSNSSGNSNSYSTYSSTNSSSNSPKKDPSLEENGGTGKTITDKLDEAKEGGTVLIQMNGSTTVNADWLKAIAGQDVDMVLDMGNGITMTINGKSITGTKFSDIDLAVVTNSNHIPVSAINNITGEENVMQISFEYDGELGFTATMTINLDKKNKGLIANLYYYNEKTKTLEFMGSSVIGNEGNADLGFKHFSDYAIIIDKVSLAPEDVAAGAGVTADESLAASDAADSRNNIVAFVITVLISAVLFTIKLKKRTTLK